ncbi:MAG: hypothetical protein WD696_00895 [Bryobacteraceae bacterium]
MSEHPSEARLALFAGGELGRFAHWRIARHVSTCPHCGRTFAAFSEIRSAMGLLAERDAAPPSWDRLAAEMKANIRLGLEAGECVALDEAAPEFDSGLASRRYRAMVASACAAALLVTAMWLHPIEPHALKTARPAALPEGVFLAASGGGIDLNDGGSVLSLRHNAAGEVTVSVGAQGSVRARFVDSETGYVTINNVYAE